MIILASASPRRKELLSLVVSEFQVYSIETDESLSMGISPMEGVQELAYRKAKEVSQRHPDAVVIGADTMVVVDDKLLGKPTDESHAFDMLSLLSGRCHHVFTGVSIQQKERCITFYRQAEVEFAQISTQEIMEYIATKDPMDKAGAYGIQGKAACFIKGIKGDYYSVMGLPVQGVYENLRHFLT